MTKLFTPPPVRGSSPSRAEIRRRTGLGLTALACTLFTAACAEQQPLCEERTKRCLGIETGDVGSGGTTRFEIELTNVCHEEIEYKLCFEVPGDGADCRQGLLASTRRAGESIALDRFGGRTRIFVRYSSEAKACRFPLSRDVEF